MKFNEDAFEGTVEIVASAMEEAEVELNTEGGEQVADFFTAIYKRLSVLADEDEDEEEDGDEDGDEEGEDEEETNEEAESAAEEEEAHKNGRTGIFEVYQDKSGEYRFRLKAANGQIIAASEGYTTKAACLNGVESVKRSATGAVIKEL